MDWSDPTYTALRAAITAEDLVRQRIVRQLEQAKSAAQAGRYLDVEIALSLMETHLTAARQRGTEVALRESAIRRKAAKGRKMAGGAC